jgi:hypothetical protein
MLELILTVVGAIIGTICIMAILWMASDIDKP